MSEPSAPPPHQPTDYASVIEATLWPVLLLTPDGRIRAASAPAHALLGAPPRLDGLPLDALLVSEDQTYMRVLLEQVVEGGAPALARVHLEDAGPRQQIEIELTPHVVGGTRCVTGVIYPGSMTEQRERLILASNLLAPKLLDAQTYEDVWRLVDATVRAVGFGASIMLREPGSRRLRLVFDSSSQAVFDLMGVAGRSWSSIGELTIDSPVMREVISKRAALFSREARALHEVFFAPPEAERSVTAQRLSGVHGFVYAPLMDATEVFGVLGVWGPLLSPEETPFIAAFGHQIGGALAQIDLRRRMEQQIQRLTSLATTARAVTSLGALDDVLLVICEQARELLEAEFSGVALLAPDGRTLVVSTDTGRWAEALRGVSLPIEDSHAGAALQSEGGLLFDDVRAEPGAYRPVMDTHDLRAAMFYPLRHQGRTLGVIAVAHTRAGRFGQDDLAYLGRYAEYAAIAVANAQLHAALRGTAADNDRLYREAEATRRYLDAIIQNAPDVMAVCRRDTTMQILNAGPLVYVGYRAEDLHGRSFLDLFPADQHQELMRRWDAAFSGRFQRFESEVYRADGSRFTALITANLVPGYEEVLVITKDVTDQRRLEAQIRQSDKLAALGRLVAGAAHELNNPLAVILGLAQLQLLEDLPESTRQDITAIERAALRAGAIVQQLRIFARPQQLKIQPVSIADLAREVAAQLGGALQAAEVTLAVECPDDLPPAAGEPHQIEQVLHNIVHNALQALSANPLGAPRRLTIRAWAEDGSVRVTVSDTGPGIAPDHLPQIFEPFFTTRDVGQGLGLGLTIVHVIVQQHGGEVWVNSQPGEGTTFDLRLPAATAAVAELPPLPSIPPGTRILLVEDEEMVRAVAERALRRASCTVDAVASGAEALELASAGDYALVVSDLQMPGMSGSSLFDALHAVRPALRWLILTGDTMGEPSRAFLERSGLPVLAKPFTQEQLLRSVADCLSGVPGHQATT